VKRRWPVPRGEVQCKECRKPVPRVAAVRLDGAWPHPVRCFAAALSRSKAQLDLQVQRALGSLK